MKTPVWLFTSIAVSLTGCLQDQQQPAASQTTDRKHIQGVDTDHSKRLQLAAY